MFHSISSFSFNTNRFLVRLVDINDVNDYFEICSSKNTTRYLTFEPFKTLKEAKRTITNMLRSYYQGDIINYSIVEKISKKVIGSISLTFFKNNNQTEIGYLLNEIFFNKRVMSEILPAFISYTFDFYHVDLIFAKVINENIYSIKLLENNGFIFQEEFNNSMIIHKQIVNVLYYFFTYDKYLLNKN